MSYPGILAPAGSEDYERPDVEPGLQSLLADIPARSLLARVEGELLEAGNVEEMAFLSDLRAPGSDHGWL